MASTVAKLESSGFLPVGTPKTVVYAALVDNEEAFYLPSHCGCLSEYPQLQRRPMMRRVEAFIESHGEHLELLL
jgi:hypothetical protein